MGQQYSHWRTGAAVAVLAFAGTLAAPAAAETAQGATAQTASAGAVRPYYGNLRPFYGNLRPFYGNLRPFYGNLRPFWGNLRPFWGDTGAFYGDLSTFWATSNPVVVKGAPDYLKVGDFWTAQGGQYDQIFNGWDATPGDYSGTAAQLKSLLGGSRDFWGAAVTAQTKKSFDEGFANPLLAKYGINLDDPTSLSKLDQTDRAMFFLDYYDGLMNFAGTDHVDHWMKTINWTPALTKVQGAGADVRIGILDQSITDRDIGKGSVKQYKGTSDFTDGHGDAVASLIAGSHDGQGVMGMAPNAKVYAYNPFDATGTANWDEVADGVRALKASGASVVNMSLGVPGTTFDQGWNGVFASLSTTLILKNTVFVVAAGNDGVTQTKNVAWMPTNPAMIIVGSVGLDETISNFSNRPGDACLTTLGLFCLPGQKLQDRFIVAPGELVLVSDGQGGVVRQTGTSFAAPLVSGAIALLHNRWPWLANFPNETVDIILRSAKDLGAPGTDAVYGRGLLDVEASQAPLDYSKLIWFTVEKGKMTPQTKSAVLQAYKTESQKSWDAKGAYFYAFEPLGLLTQRDFAIPLSQKLVGQNVTTYMGGKEQFQAYLLARMDDWAAAGGKLAYQGANSFASSSYPVANPWGANMSVSFSPRRARVGYRDEGPAFQTAFNIEGERSHVAFGFGDGAPALGGQTGFAQASDYDLQRGGANPLLGLASGSAYANWSYGLTERLHISVGSLRRDDERDRTVLPALRIAGNGAERYEADAQHFTMSYAPVDGLTLTGSYTRLHEGSGLLGIQSLDPQDFRHGATTDGYSVGVNWAAASKLSISATGTLGKTRQSGADQTLSVDKGGLTTTAFEMAVARTDLFSKGDRFTVSVSQPMFVERGHLNVTGVQVIDRTTGEIGSVTQSFDISGKRQVSGEALYLRPVSGGQGDVALFGRVESGTEGTRRDGYTTGARYRISF